ncbi:MAG: sulfite exporter TauE/SafE family protein, partial [Saprospiraceae bacterium]
GFSLLLSALFMMIDTSKELKKLPRYSNALIGGGIGILSGMVGIGGGIFLSPLLHLSKWDKPKIIAATSAAFILANSLSGLLGQVYAHGFNIEWKTISVLVLAVILGSQIGIRMTIFKLNPMHVKRLTAFVILLVSLRLLFKYI